MIRVAARSAFFGVTEYMSRRWRAVGRREAGGALTDLGKAPERQLMTKPQPRGTARE